MNYQIPTPIIEFGTLAIGLIWLWILLSYLGYPGNDK
tara:strand:+ start:965 stop:1075 length:111 start_codon:yes stop_codon:yes gene_type:complete